MNHIKLFEQYEKEDNYDLIISKGTELFHSSGENFNHNDIKTGGYDGVLWTTEESGLSQTYIPVAGASSFTSSEAFTRPGNKNGNESGTFTNKLGITWTDIEYADYPPYRHVSSKTPKEFQGIYDEYKKELDIDIQLHKEKRELQEQFTKAETKEERRRLATLIHIDYEKKIAEQSKILDQLNPEARKNEIINNKLKALGYKPSRDYGYRNQYDWKLKLKFIDGVETILPADYRSKGRLFILKPKRDFKIFDYAKDSESDLSNPDYHKIGLFRKVEQSGYDGIKIHDFAQVESEGNFGHTSIGIFANSIKDLDIEIVDNVEHPDAKEFERMYKTRDWESKEYKQFKNK